MGNIMDKVTKIVSEKDKDRPEKVESNMEKLEDKKGKIAKLEEKLGDFTHACKEFHEVENSLGISLKEAKDDIMDDVKSALSMY
jgi:hypothetical protein